MSEKYEIIYSKNIFNICQTSIIIEKKDLDFYLDLLFDKIYIIEIRKIKALIF